MRNYRSSRTPITRRHVLFLLLIGLGCAGATHPGATGRSAASARPLTVHAPPLLTLLTLRIGRVSIALDSSNTLPEVRHAVGSGQIDTVGQSGDMVRQLCYEFGRAPRRAWLALGSSVMGGDSMIITEYHLQSTPIGSTHCSRLSLDLRDVQSAEGVFLGIGSEEFKARTSPRTWVIRGDTAKYDDTARVQAIWPETGKPVEELAGFGSIAVFRGARLSSLYAWKVTSD